MKQNELLQKDWQSDLQVTNITIKLYVVMCYVFCTSLLIMNPSALYVQSLDPKIVYSKSIMV